MKKVLCIAITTLLSMSIFASCSFGGTGENSSSSSSGKPLPSKPTTIQPITYYEDEIVTAEQTEAGSVEAWAGEVLLEKPIAGDQNDNRPKANSIIHSPWHTLTINGVDVPVYSARAAKGVHSWAWVDVTSNKNNFALEVELTMTTAYGKCVVLPESAGVGVQIENNTYQAMIREYGSYTFTFEKDVEAEYTDHTAAPLTIMVTREEAFKVPEGYNVVEVEPGRHEASDLCFKDEYTTYVMKAGLHEILGGIELPSNTNLHIEHGAYLKGIPSGNQNDASLISSTDTFNVHVRSRGVMDCGLLLGAPEKYKYPLNFYRVEEASVEGVTVINSNNWSFSFYYCDNLEVNRNLMIGYRQNSDGIMMSECINSAGRYNFVRTGDDAIEFKGTGWGGSREGHSCIYEYNAVWTDKSTAYGIIWENACEMRDMIFRHNSVGFALPTWNSSMCALDVRLGLDTNTRWGDVIFEDIEIYHVVSPNVITVQVIDGGAICENILFKDIRIHSVESWVCLFKMDYGGKGSIKNIQFQNVNFCGKQIQESDKIDFSIFNNQAGKYFDELSIE